MTVVAVTVLLLTRRHTVQCTVLWDRSAPVRDLLLSTTDGAL
jgi:hypothetical protein